VGCGGTRVRGRAIIGRGGKRETRGGEGGKKRCFGTKREKTSWAHTQKGKPNPGSPKKKQIRRTVGGNKKTRGKCPKSEGVWFFQPEVSGRGGGGKKKPGGASKNTMGGGGGGQAPKRPVFVQPKGGGFAVTFLPKREGKCTKISQTKRKKNPRRGWGGKKKKKSVPSAGGLARVLEKTEKKWGGKMGT